MKVELIVALVAGAVALASAAGTALGTMRNTDRTNANARAVEQLKAESERSKAAEVRRREISDYSEPLARAAYDLQSRLFNTLQRNFMGVYVSSSDLRERDYAVNNTVYALGQYLCWTELARREIQFIDLGESGQTRRLLALQDSLYGILGTDSLPPLMRIFAGEQRAFGEALIQTGRRGPECMGYGAFLKTFGPGVDPLIDAIRADVARLGSDLPQAADRLTRFQHALIDLLQLLDPQTIRFPPERRSKA